VNRLIEKISENNLELLLRMEQECFPDHPWTILQLRSHISNSHPAIIWNDANPSGYLIYLENDYETEILRMGVLPKYRTTGIAQKMILFLKAKKKPVILEVSSDNIPAVSLYQKTGFIISRKRNSYYSDGSNAVLMEFHPK